MPPSIDFDWILNLDNIIDALSDLLPDLQIVKISLIKLSFCINSKSDDWFNWLRGIDTEPSIAEVENSSFSLTSIKSILLGCALYNLLKSLALILLILFFFSEQ